MRFQHRYLLYILVIHGVLAGLTFQLLKENKGWFIASEGLIIGSVYIAFRFYRTFRQPAAFIASGVEAIKDQDFTVKFVPTGNAGVDELIQVYNLMIDHLRHERVRQAEQQFFLDKLIDAAPLALLIFDYDARISSANPRARDLLNLTSDALLGQPLSAIPHPLLSQLVRLPPDQPHILKGGGAEAYRVLRGQFIDRGFRRQFLFIEELTAEIIETEKKAYGKVIRMMAHEINNSIGAVNSILDVTQTYVSEPDVKHAVQVAIERNDRLNQFMRRFADVVRLPQPQKRPVDMSELARNVVRLMQPQAQARGIHLTGLADAASPQIADVEQLEQVLVNVVKNALEACQPGQCVEVLSTPGALCIRDNGLPIPEAIAVNLFAPFYSTKPGGQGIGLTLTREILLNHQFSFSLKTQADGWTVFRIAFA